MKNTKFWGKFILLLFSTMLSSCSAITGIFKAGMGFGIFAAIAVILVIVFLVMRSGNKK